jgi:hypothetical protein
VGGHRVRRSFSSATLARLRDLPSEVALARLATTVKPDPTYIPVRDAGSRRWHAHTPYGDFEILTTGPKWYTVIDFSTMPLPPAAREGFEHRDCMQGRWR